MLRIRKLTNPYLETNLKRIEEVKEIIKVQFPDIPVRKISEFIEQLINPMKFKSLTYLFVAENIKDNLRGFALLMYMPDVSFCFLDFIAVLPGRASSGVGGALYQKVRDEARSLKAHGLFFECWPDDPSLCNDKKTLEQNKQRLQFYERFGARPIINTKYEERVKPEDDCPPYLVFDALDKDEKIPNQVAKDVIRAILERKYGDYCSPAYVDMIVNSVQDDPVQLRKKKYSKTDVKFNTKTISANKKISVYINEKHSIHHVKEKGYVESPARISSIKKEIFKSDIFVEEKMENYPDKFILNVHDKGYFKYFRKICSYLPPNKSVYPYVFPIRNAVRPPKELSVKAGYYCFDTFTPLNKNAFLAAKNGVNCALTAADAIISGKPSAYVLTRPPGHHAEHATFGGFCYFNNCAVAADHFSKFGKVVILDIDYHHGNGQQQIFYKRNDVLTISVHGHPSFAYPYFTGFGNEKGEDKGAGFNYNFPLSENISYDSYLKVLLKTKKIILKFKPNYLIIALGFDVAKNDPTGTWDFSYSNLFDTGNLLGDLKLPTLIVQEGGYKTNNIGIYAKYFFNGFYQSRYGTEV